MDEITQKMQNKQQLDEEDAKQSFNRTHRDMNLKQQRHAELNI
jgi:hypothetical protein